MTQRRTYLWGLHYDNEVRQVITVSCCIAHALQVLEAGYPEPSSLELLATGDAPSAPSEVQLLN